MVNQTSNSELSNFLKIAQIGSFVRNLNTESRMWSEYFRPYIGDNFSGRQIQYLNITSLGVSALQPLPADGTGLYPESSRSGQTIATAHAKEWGWPVSVPNVILNKEAGPDSIYAQTFTTELENKQKAFGLLKSAELIGDGSGAIGKVSSATVTSNQLVITLDQSSSAAARSNIWWFQEEDHILIHAEDSTDHNQYSTGNDADYWRIEDIDVDDGTLTLQAVSGGSDVNTVSGQTNVAAGDYLYRKGHSGAIPDLSSISGDYEDLSYSMVGLESLAAKDGRQVHGLTKSGNLAGTRLTKTGTFSNQMMQRLLSRGLQRVGENTYTYEKAFMSYSALDTISDANETSRRYEISDKGMAGFGMLGFQRQGHKVEYCSDRFVQDSRVYVLPKAPATKRWQDAPLSFVGGLPFEVDPGNQGAPYMLGIGTSGGRTGYTRENVIHFEQQGVAIARHAAAIMVLEGFSLPSVT